MSHPKSTTLHSMTHVLGSPEGDPGDTGHLLQAQTEEGLARLTLRARLDLVKGSLGSRVLLMVVLVVMFMVMVMIMVVMLVVGVDFLDGSRHLGGGESAIVRRDTRSSKRGGSNPSFCKTETVNCVVLGYQWRIEHSR